MCLEIVRIEFKTKEIVLGNKTTTIKKLMKINRYELLNKLKTNMGVKFDDNVTLDLTANEIIYNSFIFTIFDHLPGMKIKSTYSINNFYKEGIYVSKSLNSCFEVILKDILARTTFDNVRYISDVTYRRMFEIMNDIYNNI